MILRLCLDEQVVVHCHATHFYRFHREELLIHAMHKLSFGIPHFFLGESVLGTDESRWGVGFNFMLMHLDEICGDLASTNVFIIWVTMFAMLVEVARSKHSTVRNKHEDFPGKMLMVTLMLLTFVA